MAKPEFSSSPLYCLLKVIQEHVTEAPNPILEDEGGKEGCLEAGLATLSPERLVGDSRVKGRGTNVLGRIVSSSLYRDLRVTEPESSPIHFPELFQTRSSTQSVKIRRMGGSDNLWFPYNAAVIA